MTSQSASSSANSASAVVSRAGSPASTIHPGDTRSHGVRSRPKAGTQGWAAKLSSAHKLCAALALQTRLSLQRSNLKYKARQAHAHASGGRQLQDVGHEIH